MKSKGQSIWYILIVLVMALVLILWGSFMIKKVEDHGLKNIVEGVWFGKGGQNE